MDFRRHDPDREVRRGRGEFGFDVFRPAACDVVGFARTAVEFGAEDVHRKESAVRRDFELLPQGGPPAGSAKDGQGRNSEGRKNQGRKKQSPGTERNYRCRRENESAGKEGGPCSCRGRTWKSKQRGSCE